MEPFDVEILRTGIWHGSGCPKEGCKFTEDDLHDMVTNFQLLKDQHKAPLKRGHSVEVGDIALGWVEELRVEGDRLIGKFTDMPTIVREAIKKKLFKNVSIEAMKNVVLGGKKLKGWVLDAVALLGAEIPAVSGLKDLDHYLASRSLEHGPVATFSTINGNLKDKQEFKMDEEMKKRLDAIESRLAASDDKIVKLTTENEGLKAENAKMKREAEEKAANERKGKIELNRKQVTDLLETAVKGKLILPAQREKFSKLLKTTDDDAMLAINVKDVEELIETSSGGTKMKFNREEGRTGTKLEDRQKDDAGEELHRLAVAYQDEHPKIAYDIALTRVMQQHPALAAEHVGGLEEVA